MHFNTETLISEIRMNDRSLKDISAKIENQDGCESEILTEFIEKAEREIFLVRNLLRKAEYGNTV